MGLLSTDSPDLGASSVLGYASGDPSADLHDRLDLALRYIANWYTATHGSTNQDLWWAKIDQVRAKVETAEQQITSSDVFPSTSELNLYNDASQAYAGLYEELYSSADTLPQPALIDQAADLLSTIAETPGYLVTKAAGLVGHAINDSAKAFFLASWPVLLVAGVAVFVFRKPLAKALALSV